MRSSGGIKVNDEDRVELERIVRATDRVDDVRRMLPNVPATFALSGVRRQVGQQGIAGLAPVVAPLPTHAEAP